LEDGRVHGSGERGVADGAREKERIPDRAHGAGVGIKAGRKKEENERIEGTWPGVRTLVEWVFLRNERGNVLGGGAALKAAGMENETSTGKRENEKELVRILIAFISETR